MSSILLILLLTWSTMNVVTCVFFHEPSAIPLKREDGIDFGFSMGYQKAKNTLVISAPIENNTMHSSIHTIGRVYTCPLTDLNNMKCDLANIDVKKLADYNIDKINPNQNFLLGASIVTTPDYFLTCAPLWTSELKNIASSRTYSFSYGTCFVYNGTAYQYLGYPERFIMNYPSGAGLLPHSFEGGIGWNTLIDEKNDLILINKPFSTNAGNFYYLDTKDPLAVVGHLKFTQNNMQNVGFGMAAGKFFSNNISYAISVQDYTMTGKIFFLEIDHSRMTPKKKNNLKMMCRKTKERNCAFVNINDNNVGSMFGYTMAAVDVDGDGFTELIVGAPAQRDETPEYGAVHIYVGGKVGTGTISPEKSMQNSKKTIFGNVDGSRFGMTIAASDIDGDDIPEIIVSAPYEDSGKGAVYIISGHKVYKTFFAASTRQVQVSKLEPQKIQKSDFKLFGYSLQVIEDLDANGCNELAIGSPGSSIVFLYRSLQAVKVNVTLSSITQKISDKDYKFDVTVCLLIEFNKKTTHVEGNILVNNFAYGNGAKLNDPKFNVNLFEMFKNKQTQYCKNVTVNLENSDTGVYTFNTAIEMSELQKSLEESDFSKTVATFSSHSERKRSIQIDRRCDGDDCMPKLSMKVVWLAGSEYTIGTSENETLTITVYNDGFNANGGCVLVAVNGAKVRRSNANCKDIGDHYKCPLRTPLRRNTSEVISIDLDMMTSVTNLNKSLDIKVWLYEDCYNQTQSTDFQIVPVTYKLDTSLVHLTSENYNFDITEKSLADDTIQTLNISQVYLIHNTGKLKWLDLDAVVTFNKTEFEFTVKEIAGMRNCSKSNEITHELRCKVDLEPEYITKVILGLEIQKESFGPYITTMKETKIESTMNLALTEYTIGLNSRSESTVTYNKDTTVGNNKFLLIFFGILVALLLLGGLCLILYKYGFFQGQNKKKLDRARATVRHRSIKQSTTSQDTEKLHEDSNPCDMEILDDNTFEEPTPAPSKNNHKLIEEKAQVHNENQH